MPSAVVNYDKHWQRISERKRGLPGWTEPKHQRNLLLRKLDVSRSMERDEKGPYTTIRQTITDRVSLKQFTSIVQVDDQVLHTSRSPNDIAERYLYRRMTDETFEMIRQDLGNAGLSYTTTSSNTFSTFNPISETVPFETTTSTIPVTVDNIRIGYDTTGSVNVFVNDMTDTTGSAFRDNYTITPAYIPGQVQPNFQTYQMPVEDVRAIRRDQLRAKIRKQLAPTIITSRSIGYGNAADFSNVSPAEVTALGLLKRMVNPLDWRRYLTHGFLVVQGHSGLKYQVWRSGRHIRVFQQGKKIGELCIHVDNSVPLTDRVIAKKVMIECDEPGIWARSGIHRVPGLSYSSTPTEHDLKQLAA